MSIKPGKPLFFVFVIIFTFLSLPSLAARSSWINDIPQITSSRSGNTVLIRSNYESASFVRFFIREGTALKVLQRTSSGGWYYNTLSADDANYVRRYYANYTFSSASTFSVNVHGNVTWLKIIGGQVTVVAPPEDDNTYGIENPPPTFDRAIWNCRGAGKTTRVSDTDSFHRALAIAQPGETILLRPGPYGNLVVNKGGAENNPIHIAAENPAVDASATPLPGATKSSVASVNVSANYISICGLYFNDQAHQSALHEVRTDAIVYRQNHFRTGIIQDEEVDDALSFEKGGNAIGVINNYFEGNDSRFALDYGLRLHATTNVLVRGNKFTGVFNHQLATKENVSNILVDRNIFTGCGQVCVHIGQTADFDRKDYTGGAIYFIKNKLIEGYTAHPQSRYRKGIVVRNHTKTVIKDNIFQGAWTDTIYTDFMSGGGLKRFERRVLGIYGERSTSLLIEKNQFNVAAELRFTGRGTGSNDRITVKDNTGNFNCSVATLKRPGVKPLDEPSINMGAPTLVSCD